MFTKDELEIILDGLRKERDETERILYAGNDWPDEILESWEDHFFRTKELWNKTCDILTEMKK
jgi:hypothetical protein